MTVPSSRHRHSRPTEALDARFEELDTWPIKAAVQALIEGQLAAVATLVPLAANLAAAAEALAERVAQGGRLIYVGAGTSGRIAAHDAAELTPTFGFPAERIAVVLAGGPSALVQAAEGAEDNAAEARAALAALRLSAADAVIALAASGRTRFVLAAVQEARAAGALTIALFNNPGAPIARLADYPLCLPTGAEAVAGSTRMKAGTAQRAALTVLSTAVFVRLGSVYRGRMVAMRPQNAKLRARAAQMVAELTGKSLAEATTALDKTAGEIREAVLMLALDLDREAARARLAAAGGRLAEALSAPP